MKVFNLQCDAGHDFEGWFGSEDDFLSQTACGLLTCPVCGTPQVLRMPSAPRLNLSGAQAPKERAEAVVSRAGGLAPAPGSAQDRRAEPVGGRGGEGTVSSALPVNPRQAEAMEAMFLQAVKHVLANTEDVGARFADEARRIHHGDIEHRNIRGQTTPEQAQELADEGIEVFSLPVPDGLTGPSH